MTDRPIIFSAPMVRALLDGRKSQTRRVVKDRGARPEYCGGRYDDRNDPSNWGWEDHESGEWVTLDRFRSYRFVPYAPGDRLWVREAFNAFQFSQDGDEAWPVRIPTLDECEEAEDLAYRYGAPQIVFRESDRARKWFVDQKWRPSIHMPRWASRLTLIVTDVRVQRLQGISEADAVAEGLATVTKDSNLWKWGIADSDGLPGNDDHGWHWNEWQVDPRAAFMRLWNSIHGPDAWAENPWVVAISFDVKRANIDQIGGDA